MSTVRIASIGFALCLLSVIQAGEANREKIVGVWEVVKSVDTTSGSTVEFTNDGKLILNQKGAKAKRIEATYRVEGKKLTTIRRENGKDETNVLEIVTLNDTTLITLNDKGSTDELRRQRK